MRKVAILCSALAVAAVLASSAFAAAPTKTSFSVTDVPATLTGVCSFDVAVSSDISGFEIDYTDRSGALTRVYLHNIEQDTFSANGKSITGEPFTFNLDVLFDSSGSVTHVYASGVVERLVPSGTLFLSAGRADFVQHPGGRVLAVSRCRQSGRRGGVLRRAVVTRDCEAAHAGAPPLTAVSRGAVRRTRRRFSPNRKKCA